MTQLDEYKTAKKITKEEADAWLATAKQGDPVPPEIWKYAFALLENDIRAMKEINRSLGVSK